MLNLSKIDVSTMEGDTMPDEKKSGKVSTNVYFPTDLAREIRDEVNNRKDFERTYSATALVEEACRLYLGVLRYHKEARSTQKPYDFTMDALKTFLGRKRK